MEMYVCGSGNVSAQRLGADGWPEVWTIPPGDRLALQEPDYGQLFDPKIIRRMSRVIRMGVAAAHQAARADEGRGPTSIIAGTAYGCLADTEVFLRKMIEQDEAFLSPTAFIQSTHNTVAGQIAMMLRCHGHNNTFVHRGLSFEHALLDAALLLEEEPTQRILVGGVDEITESSLSLLKRFGVYRGDHGKRGYVAGEGSSFFLLTASRGNDFPVRIRELVAGEDTSPESMRLALDQVLASSRHPIDLVLHGEPGGEFEAKARPPWLPEPLESVPRLGFKPFCGEFPTASAFGLWMACGILEGRAVPDGGPAVQGKVQTILLVNTYLDRYYSMMLLENAGLL